MVNKKAVIISTIIALIVAILIIFVNIRNLRNVEETIADVPENSNELLEENTTNTENNLSNDVANNTVNDSIDEEENTVENTPTTNTQSNTSTVNEDNENSDAEDVAIQLAKEEWGEDNEDVYYYIEENLSENVYVVSVRDKNTTATLANYEVNIETEQVSEY